MRGRSLVLLAVLAPSFVGADEVRYRVVDRRELDGSVLLVRQVPRQRIGGKPFLAANHWELTPSTDYFRVKDAKIPARHVGQKADPPAITFRDGQVVGNSWTNMFGGKAQTFFEKGEIVRLARLHTAFKTVRMDLESVCRPGEIGRRLQGRVDFGLSGQVGGKTLEEANAAVSGVLEPLELARVMETCDPETGAGPVAIFPGTPYTEIRERIGYPRQSQTEGSGYLVDYDVVQLRIRDGQVAKIIIPSID